MSRTRITLAGCLCLGLLITTPGAAGARARTTRVSVRSNGDEGNGGGGNSSISSSGRFVAFESPSSNLVPSDANNSWDIFVHDRKTGKTTRVSVRSNGDQSNGHSFHPSISADGRFIAFSSEATNLVPSDTNQATEPLVDDRKTGKTTRVSVRSNGDEADGFSSLYPSISADGRFVTFYSFASNLVPGDSNDAADIFVHDRKTGKTTRASVQLGLQANGASLFPAISADGRFVAFYSFASNWAFGDTNGADVFVHDRKSGRTALVSVTPGDDPGNGPSFNPAISADGRFVAFHSFASDLVPGDTNDVQDVFVRDRKTGKTKRVSVRSNGNQGDLTSYQPSISANGRFVAFYSFASNLVPGDTNGFWDIFLHDRTTGKTTRLSIRTSGEASNGDSFNPSISADGRFVAFYSTATNLVPGDTNNAQDVFVRGPLN